MWENLEKKAKKYFTKKLVKSDYLKDTATFLHLTILSFLTRTIFNFVITSRLQTSIYAVDMFFSICVTIFFSIYSPFFYMMINRMLKTDADDFSRYLIEKFWKEGWEYFEYWKVRILTSVSLFGIILLCFIDINSYMIQEFIGHTLISSAIVDTINKYRLIKDKDEVKREDEHIATRVISAPEIREYSPERKPIFKNVRQVYKEENKFDFSIMEDYE